MTFVENWSYIDKADLTSIALCMQVLMQTYDYSSGGKQMIKDSLGCINWETMNMCNLKVSLYHK